MQLREKAREVFLGEALRWIDAWQQVCEGDIDRALRAAKCSGDHLFRVALWMLAARWLDIYMQIAPSTGALHTGVGFADALLLVGFSCAFLLVLSRSLGAAPLLARRDPYCVESLHHQV
ncbi:MAG: hypothetical protein EXS14_08390 [Planctomycetes bacterium]|nr:hypothetical protein [Planctomycetota bacterium]